MKIVSSSEARLLSRRSFSSRGGSERESERVARPDCCQEDCSQVEKVEEKVVKIVSSSEAGLFREKMLRMKKGKITHRHLYYTVFFNNVCLEEKSHVCVLEDQKATYTEQLNTKAKSLPDKYKFLLHYGPNCCIYCTHTKDLKSSGEAKATCNFITHDYSQQEMLHGATNKIYIQQRDIDEVFDRQFVSHGTMNKICSELNVRVLEIMEASPVQEVAKTIQNAIQLKLNTVKNGIMLLSLPIIFIKFFLAILLAGSAGVVNVAGAAVKQAL